MEDKKMRLPAIALRGLTVLPQMTINFDIIRGKSIAAVEKAMVGDQKVLLITQVKPEEMNPDMEDLFHIGTVGFVKQLVKMPGGMVRVTVEGLEKAELLELDNSGSTLTATAELLGDMEDDLNVIEKEAMLRIVKEKLEEYGKLNQTAGKDFLLSLISASGLEEILHQLAVQFPWDFEARQRILECTYLSSMYETVLQLLLTETEVYRVKKEFQTKVKAAIDKNQKDYILREQMRVIREELGEDNPVSDADELKKQLKSIKADKEIKDRILKEINRFKGMPSGSQDANVLRTYLETVLELPWNKVTKDNSDLKFAEKVLEEDHYGLTQVKERVLEYLAVRILTKKGTSPIICLVGPPGTGKTSIARSVARALGKKYVRISLGGVHDEAEIRGHRKTYVGAMPGRIVEGIKLAGVSNPLMLLDEIDKVSSDYKGDTSSALLEVLDSEQNIHFRDHYIELPINLSEVLFIATANTTQTIPGPLLDRMELIEVNSYTENEKFHIGKNYLIRKQMEKNGLTRAQLTITNPALEKIIHNYTREAGVRNLERRIGDICRKAARELLEQDKKSIRITDKNLEKYLGREKVLYEDANDEDQVGIVRGLAWTSVGGDTLQIEVNVMPGKGNLQMTGQLGDVMKESAQTALTWVRSVASVKYRVPEDYFETHDIHIHIPEGAVPKDGPSAGITMATAMLSAVTERFVSAKTAMTGEITLRGHVLMIGGLKEKLLAAKMAHIEKVLVPDKNRPDVEELSKEITKGMDIVYVKEMEDVIREAFVTGCTEDEAADRERDASSAALAEAAATVAVKPERKGKP
ncbi:endopeptidase La [Clostridium transplantifaecale]|uniref:endopeptidase La n=1 Tax=Clostridium transplantifaecale TaxID=2479838 RepID=UPI000F6375D8|nr:endopeptidase La [Clostridium transplantifaecale]